MTFGDKDGSGGFFISPGAIINVVAASAIGGIALMVLGNNSDIASMREGAANSGYAIHRLEATETSIDQTITTILGNQRGLQDATESNSNDYKRLHEEVQDLRKQFNDFEHSLSPPRNGH